MKKLFFLFTFAALSAGLFAQTAPVSNPPTVTVCINPYNPPKELTDVQIHTNEILSIVFNAQDDNVNSASWNASFLGFGYQNFSTNYKNYNANSLTFLSSLNTVATDGNWAFKFKPLGVGTQIIPLSSTANSASNTTTSTDISNVVINAQMGIRVTIVP